jgi:pimeloyl-ACP methyl ester carboxylesterase
MATTPQPGRLEVQTVDGRRLDVLVAGWQGVPIILHHGTAGANTQFAPWVEAALSRGLRLVTYSRPGYGASDRAPGRTVADCAGDVALILDAVRAEACVTIGPSGGGPHALAVAALLPQRTLACATVGSLGMFGMVDLDFFDGMGADLKATYRMAASRDDLGLVGFIEDYRRRLDQASPTTLLDTRNTALAKADLDALGGRLGTYLYDDARAALSNGPWGWVDDALAFTRPWGFDLDDVSVPVTVWQGGQDRMVPPAHGAWLAAHIPNAVGEFRAQHGHFSLAVDGFEDIIDRVMEAAGAAR